MDNVKIYVCETFVPATLGYYPKNDSILKSVGIMETGCVAVKKTLRGYFSKKTKVSTKPINGHTWSFHSIIAHYRREQAPNPLYLQSEISNTQMHKDFREK